MKESDANNQYGFWHCGKAYSGASYERCVMAAIEDDPTIVSWLKTPVGRWLTGRTKMNGRGVMVEDMVEDGSNSGLDISIDHLQAFVDAAVRLISNRACVAIKANIGLHVIVEAQRCFGDGKDIIRIDVQGLT